MYSRKRTYIFGLARAECFITFVRSREWRWDCWCFDSSK